MFAAAGPPKWVIVHVPVFETDWAPRPKSRRHTIRHTIRCRVLRLRLARRARGLVFRGDTRPNLVGVRTRRGAVEDVARRRRRRPLEAHELICSTIQMVTRASYHANTIFKSTAPKILGQLPGFCTCQTTIENSKQRAVRSQCVRGSFVRDHLARSPAWIFQPARGRITASSSVVPVPSLRACNATLQSRWDSHTCILVDARQGSGARSFAVERPRRACDV